MRIKSISYRTFMFLIIVLGASLSSCRHEGIPADQLPQVPFSKIKVIYTSYCGECHNASSPEANYNFTDSLDIRKSVVPFNASKSKSYKAMISTFQLMPPNGSMPTSERTLVRIWIDQGAKF